VTIDRTDPKLREHYTDGPLKGQQKDYLVLSDEERAKGFVRPVRQSYIHLACGCKTTMGIKIAETYARNPKFYSRTFCCNCGTHFPLFEGYRLPESDGWAFLWHPDGEPVGSNEEEAKTFKEEQVEKENAKNIGAGI
jgi:hypothetical protein